MIAICITGIPRYYKITYNSLLKNIKEDYKIFLNIIQSSEFNYDIQDIIKCYKPEKYKITNNKQKIYDEEIIEYHKMVNNTYNECINILSCIDLVKEYENENQINFQSIIKTQFDVYIIQPLYINPIYDGLYVEYKNNYKEKYDWSLLEDNLIAQNINLILNYKSLNDYINYIPDNIYYGCRKVIYKLYDLPKIIQYNKKKYETIKNKYNMITWISSFNKLLLFFTIINKLQIYEIKDVIILNIANTQSLIKFYKFFNIKFEVIHPHIDLAGNLITKHYIHLYNYIILLN